MNSLVEIGKYNLLKTISQTSQGFYLDGGDVGEILLPSKYCPPEFKKDDEISVFVYLDSEDRIIATTRKPKALVGDFAYLEVVDNTDIGSFLDWGLEKDLFVPFRNQRTPLIKRRSYPFYVYLDENSGRIVASSKYYHYLKSSYNSHLSENQEVDILVIERNKLGFKAIINNQHIGVLYRNEVYAKINLGLKTKAFIKKIREDGKIDLILNRPGFQATIDYAEELYAKIQDAQGYLPLNDKSSPQLIYEALGVSKKTFKKSVGVLYKKGKIKFEKGGISTK